MAKTPCQVQRIALFSPGLIQALIIRVHYDGLSLAQKGRGAQGKQSSGRSQ